MRKVTPKEMIAQFYYKNEAPLSDIMVPERITGNIKKRKDATYNYFADLELKIKTDFELDFKGFQIITKMTEDCETEIENAVIKAKDYNAEIKLANSVPLIGVKPNLSIWIYKKDQAFFNNLYIDYYITLPQTGKPEKYTDRIEIIRESRNGNGKVKKTIFVKENIFF